ncbi:MarR family winged helix-turn-helix transcriptional regulator [Fodinicola feengrottensis]|uniref:HTH marR-type domain-containing protein n=1 Tax=Fodinicola feengrottensis TaxID=435914 RepID=A0ABP4UR54_9ACTN|nr:MarR family transcriptional regulator [Fodinicola feengrottensis]
MSTPPAAQTLAAIHAWTRLDQAFAGLNRELQRHHQVTGAQLAILRMLDEWGEALSLQEMRDRLVMHPATLGQLVDRLASREWVALAADPDDRRRRIVRLTTKGRRLIRNAPLAGPIRLRYAKADPARLQRLAAAFEDAIVLFGLENYQPDRTSQKG